MQYQANFYVRDSLSTSTAVTDATYVYESGGKKRSFFRRHYFLEDILGMLYTYLLNMLNICIYRCTVYANV